MVVTNPYGSATSTPAQLTTLTPPAPGFSYQWMKSKDQGVTWINIAGGTSSYLPKNLLDQNDDQDWIRVAVTNSNGVSYSNIWKVDVPCSPGNFRFPNLQASSHFPQPFDLNGMMVWPLNAFKSNAADALKDPSTQRVCCPVNQIPDVNGKCVEMDCLNDCPFYYHGAIPVLTYIDGVIPQVNGYYGYNPDACNQFCQPETYTPVIPPSPIPLPSTAQPSPVTPGPINGPGPVTPPASDSPSPVSSGSPFGPCDEVLGYGAGHAYINGSCVCQGKLTDDGVDSHPCHCPSGTCFSTTIDTGPSGATTTNIDCIPLDQDANNCPFDKIYTPPPSPSPSAYPGACGTCLCPPNTCDPNATLNGNSMDCTQNQVCVAGHGSCGTCQCKIDANHDCGAGSDLVSDGQGCYVCKVHQWTPPQQSLGGPYW